MARLNDDTKLEESITSELKAIGVNEVTIDEVNQLTGEGSSFDTKEIVSPLAQSDITFSTAYSNITVNGSTIEIMRIYATPKTTAYMYHEGIVDRDVTKSGTASTLQVLKVLGEFGVGLTKVGTVVTVYTAVKDVIATIQSSSPITRVRAQYNFTCAENTVFLYYYNNSSRNWVHMGNSSSLGYAITNTVKSCYISGTNALPRHTSKDYNGLLKATNYNDAYYMYTNRIPGDVLTASQFKKFNISGVSGTSSPYVALSLLRPIIPAHCQ